jgi:hypothetical protein
MEVVLMAVRDQNAIDVVKRFCLDRLRKDKPLIAIA